ncbi:MAG: hypothetical protein ACM3ME_00495 [Chloroflexota bacterium]
MAKFLTGHNLETAFTNIIWEAKETLLMVSPSIKPGDYLKKLFDKHLNNPKIHIIIVFGKNEKDSTRSMVEEDLEYFKQFLNVSMVLVPNLHAQYYANESKGLITSISLNDYSFVDNIEFGVFFERNSLMDSLKGNADHEVWDTGMKIAGENEALFIRRPVYEKKAIALLGKNYVKSDVLYDNTRKYLAVNKDESPVKKLIDFETELAPE